MAESIATVRRTFIPGAVRAFRTDTLAWLAEYPRERGAE